MNHTEQTLREGLERARDTMAAGRPTVPSTVGAEKAGNIFLRAGTEAVRSALGMPGAAPAETFAELRRRKNAFG